MTYLQQRIIGISLLAMLVALFSLTSYGGEKDTPYKFDDESNHDIITHPAWFKQSFHVLKDDIDDAKKAGKQGIMLFVGTKQCSYCKIFIDKTLSVKDIQQRLRSNYDVIPLEIFSDDEVTDIDGKVYASKDFVYLKQAYFSPTFIFYDTDNDEVLKLVGYYPPDKFSKILDYLIHKEYKTMGLRQYLTIAEQKMAKTHLAIPHDKLFTYTRTDFNRSVAASDKPLLILLEREDCDACVRLHKNILSDTVIRSHLPDYEFAQLDMGDRTTPIVTPDGQHTTPANWAEELKIQYSPAFLFFDKSGKLVLRQESDVQAFRVKRMLKHVKNRVYLTETQFNRWLAEEYREEHKTYKTSNKLPN